ncbi:transcription factor HES-4-like [Stylophora pistillata]|uniref:transcription factor HES-4-like n=1 Tax=Stylophora pistillata TaxID=50429 RepID=UPI000C04786B|nr:transcription factor HES-4-like [Stylophora pistillata]
MSPKKPEMERKRRQRINNCLSQIKRMIPEARELEIKKGCRLEKAEILEITVKFIQKVQNEKRAEKQGEITVGPEEIPAVFNQTPAPTRLVFQSQFDISREQTASPFYSAPTCCFDTAATEYDTKHNSQNILFRPVLLPTPRYFTPRCISSNIVYDSARDGRESFAFPTRQPAVSTALYTENKNL